MNQERERMLAAVTAYVQGDPEAGPLIVQACTAGISNAMREEAEKSSDLECALAALVTDQKNDWARGVLLQKLEKWNGRLSLRWDWFLDKMKRRAA